MRVIDAATPRAFACAAADFIGDRLRDKPQSVLALPTGDTPRDLYSELAARSRMGAVSFDRAKIFNLDEYCGLPAWDEHSYAAFMQRHLVAPLGLSEAQVRLLQGDAADMDAECRAFDAALSAAGGIDLCVLGLGVNGHVAFNEPGSPWDSTTHVVHLSRATRAAQEQQARERWGIPACGVTMGIKTLLESRHILLLIAGSGKESARAALYAGAADRGWPVTSLIAHPRITVIDSCGSAARR